MKEQVSEAVADFKLGVLKNFVNSTKKTYVLESLFNKVGALKPCNSIKKRLQHRCFLVKFSNFLRTPFSQNSFRGYF